ncbi:MAG: D-2-hydroxyacid dehydrogenase [Faecousia sp.]
MKIVILDGYALNPGDLSYEPIGQFGQLTIYERTDTEAEAIARIGDSEIVLVNKVPVTESLLAACPNIKLICVQATGYNVVDCDACARRGIPVTNVPSYGTAAVAQFTIALMLEICHRIGHHDELVHQGKWENCGSFCFWDTPQMELAGKTLGIIGFGRIGQAVAKIARGFDMKVMAYNRTQRPEGRALAEYVDLDTLLARSDFISLHCPLFPQTAKLINAAAIAKMKDGAVLINTSRGGLLDEEAVRAALESGKLRAAAVDVVAQEPITGDNPLLNAPNCIITPHMAWAPVESRQRLLDCVIENIRCFLEGKPQNVVNM